MTFGPLFGIVEYMQKQHLLIAGGIGAAIVLLGTIMFLRTPAPAPSVEEDRTAAPTVPETTTNAAMLDPGPMLTVDAKEVEYMPGVKGYYAAPSEGDNHPGIVVVHEWWGLNDHIKDMARQLAGEGYAVLAVDLYGAVATTPAEAKAFSSTIDQKKATANMQAATAYLREQGARRMASLGWCFGGGQALQLALSGEQLDATVIYYGQLVTDADKLLAISWPVLGVFGDKDTAVTPESVTAFEAALEKDKITNEIHRYPGVGHAFANPSGQNYAPAETKDAWEKTRAFLRKNLEPAVVPVP